jgi:UPF0716 family protein affecting phage T7 exclusion
VVCGFLTIFIGVFLLNAPKRDAALGVVQGKTMLHTFDEENLGFIGLEDDEDDDDEEGGGGVYDVGDRSALRSSRSHGGMI